MNGALASLARRRAISVLPTPVGPIMRIFLGWISWRRGSGTCWRRQRLRRATATDFFALFCPTIFLSSSDTISLGVMTLADILIFRLECFNNVIAVRVNTQITCDLQRLFDDGLGRQIGILQERKRSRLCIGAAGADSGYPVFRFQNVAVAGQDQGVFGVGHDQHGFESAQYTIGSPVAGEFYGGSHQVALIFFELGLEAFLKGKGVCRGACEAGEDF